MLLAFAAVKSGSVGLETVHDFIVPGGVTQPIVELSPDLTEAGCATSMILGLFICIEHDALAVWLLAAVQVIP